MITDWTPLLLTLKLGVITTGILFILCLPLAWWLAGSKQFVRIPVKTMITLPLVMPPTVLGFYLLIMFSPAYSFGRFFEHAFHTRLLFSFEGIVIGSIVFSLPFMANPLIAGFESLPSSLAEAAAVLGKPKLVTLFSVLLPNLKASILTALVMSFAHTVGEFGVVLMIGGKIPGVTQVASIAIYDEIESLHYAAANGYALLLVVSSLVVISALLIVNRKTFRII